MSREQSPDIPNLRKDNLEYKPALDIIRFFAAFWVMLSHAHALEGGGHGVTIFFILSGYLIGGQLIDEKRRNGTIKIHDFYFKRVTRIWPPYFIVLFFFLIIFFARGQNHQEGFYGSMLGALTYSYNLVNDIRGYIQPTWISFNQIWSLSIEEQFYLIAPLFVSLIPASLIFYVCIAFTILAQLKAPYYAGLFVGIVLAQLLRIITSITASTHHSLIASLATLLIILVIIWKGQSEPQDSLLILLLSTLLIGIGTFIIIDRRFYPLLRYIGLMTYSYYLVHGIPVYFISPFYRKYYGTTTTPVWFNVLCGISALAISYFFVKKIELPIIAKRNQMLKEQSQWIDYAVFLTWGLGLLGVLVLVGVFYAVL